MCVDAPDTSGVNAAAQASAELGNKAFEWFKSEYDNTRPDREKAQAEASQVTQAQLATMTQQNALAKDYADYNKDTFRPLEQRMVSESQAYDTPQRRQEAADRAVADVNSSVAANREATGARLASYGVAPDSMKSQSLMASGDINAAKASAGAAAGARTQVEATGYARMADAANLGRGLPSAQATAVQTGVQAGNAAVGASGAGLNAGYSGAGLMQQGFGAAMQGLGQSGDLFGKSAGIDSATRGQDLNFVANMAKLYPSDPKIKKNRKPVSPEASMSALRGTDIEEWEYDPAKGGPDDGGKKRIGPMADNANEEMGEEVAPDGKMLNVASMLGVVTNAVKNIDQRLQAAGI